MTKREKVLIALTLVAALGGGVMLLAGPAKEPKNLPAKTNQTLNVLAELQSLAGRQSARAGQPEDLRTALESWAAVDPFQSLPTQPANQATSQEAGQGEPKLALSFNGYMEAGAFRLAIIDGLEYQVGERLPGGEYRVVSITRKAVILERTQGGGRVTLPYTGDE